MQSFNFPIISTKKKTIVLNTYFWFLRSVVHSVGWTLDKDIEKKKPMFSLLILNNSIIYIIKL